MNRQLTYQEFVAYLKEHGNTEFRTTEWFEVIPAGTILTAALTGDGNLSTFPETTGKTYPEYDFEYRWNFAWKHAYRGKFELMDDVDVCLERKLKFKVGDRVLYEGNEACIAYADRDYGDYIIERNDLNGWSKEERETDNELQDYTQVYNKNSFWYVSENELVEIQETISRIDEEIHSTNNIKSNPIKKMKALAKKMFDKDTRTLIKAGFLDESLGTTSEGREELLAILFNEKKAELVKAAEDKLAEEKENNG